MSLQSVTLTERGKYDGLHVETPLGVINIRHKLHSAGRRVVSIEILPNAYADEPPVMLDGFTNNILTEQT